MIQEVILAVLLVIIIVPLIGNAYISMSSMVEMGASIALIGVFVALAVVLWRERARDEREQLHRMLADRLGFLVGGAALVGIIVIQTLEHHLDVYAPVALLLMVLAKIIGRIYSHLRY